MYWEVPKRQVKEIDGTIGTSLGKCGITIWLVGNYLVLKSMGKVGLIMGNIRMYNKFGNTFNTTRLTISWVFEETFDRTHIFLLNKI